MIQEFLNKLTGKDETETIANRRAEIDKIAYSLWESRGGGASTDEQQQEDWRAAEKKLDGGFGALEAKSK